MSDEIERALAALLGLPMWNAGRAGDSLWLHFGDRRVITEQNGDEREVGTFALHVSCPWRLADAERILVGSGDLLTPSGADADLETFDWDEQGASWLDVRLEEIKAGWAARPPIAEVAEGDSFGGARISFSNTMRLEIFPNSTPTGHVSTEFWRLFRPATDEAHFVVGTFGVERSEER